MRGFAITHNRPPDVSIVQSLRVFLAIARLTQGLDVRNVVRAAFEQRHNVIDGQRFSLLASGAPVTPTCAKIHPFLSGKISLTSLFSGAASMLPLHFNFRPLLMSLTHTEQSLRFLFGCKSVITLAVLFLSTSFLNGIVLDTQILLSRYFLFFFKRLRVVVTKTSAGFASSIPQINTVAARIKLAYRKQELTVLTPFFCRHTVLILAHLRGAV